MIFDIDFEDFVKDVGFPGLVVGAGVLILAPVFASALIKAGKPLTKATLKGGIIAFDKGKEIWSEARETLGEVVQESRSELEKSLDNHAIDAVETVSVSSAPVED